MSTYTLLDDLINEDAGDDAGADGGDEYEEVAEEDVEQLSAAEDEELDNQQLGGGGLFNDGDATDGEDGDTEASEERPAVEDAGDANREGRQDI